MEVWEALVGMSGEKRKKIEEGISEIYTVHCVRNQGSCCANTVLTQC
jgi:hypothetical protein